MTEPSSSTSLDDPAARRSRELLAAEARAAETIVLTGGSTLGRAYERAAASEPDWSAARRSGGATSAACRPTTSARTTASPGGRCSTGWRRSPEVHRIRGELAAGRGGGRVRAGARRRRARPAAARPRPRRARRLALPRLAAARGADAPRDERAGRARAVRRPRDADAARAALGAADRVPRHRRREGRRRRARVRGPDRREVPASLLRDGDGADRRLSSTAARQPAQSLYVSRAEAARIRARAAMPRRRRRGPAARAPCRQPERPRGTRRASRTSVSTALDGRARTAPRRAPAIAGERVGDRGREVVAAAQARGEPAASASRRSSTSSASVAA